MQAMAKRYDPAPVEAHWMRAWEAADYFHAEPDSERKPYTIVIPPPNVTAALHMGHGLNSTIQDVIIRWRRMQGFEAEWLPGVDHAGIATQNVVERELAGRGLTRHDLGRDAFVAEAQAWKEKHGSRIIGQLRGIGCSCDWARERYTMDPGLSRAVLEAFVRLYRKGLIYRGNRIVNWCPRCTTGLSDEEVVHGEHEGSLWYVRYPLEGGGRITVATTRPETILGDVAVAVNPADDRHRSLVGRTAILPVLGRRIPVIADAFVDPEFGTGAVKVTPAHDPNDFEIGERCKLEPVLVMDETGRMNENAGPDYAGLDRFEAREKLVAQLRADGLLESIEPHQHAVGHCDRCKTIVEPYLSEQWFCDQKSLAGPAIAAVDEGTLRFHPERWTKVYLQWLENIRPWCLSRQLWWGHRIPIWYCGECGEVIVAVEPPERCTRCRSPRLRQDEDVLDTWFSSGLWPFSTFGWPDDTPELRYFYPTNTLATAPEIIFLWVARMVMLGCELMGKVPFGDVLLHGTVRDTLGRKFSKSLGNGFDPMEVVEDVGADSLRFSAIGDTSQGQDVYLSLDSFDAGRNFANKVWNAARFVLSASEGFDPEGEDAEGELADRWIRARLTRTIREVTGALDAFRLSDAARTVYHFIRRDFCDWYIELAKPRVAGNSPNAQTAKRTLLEVLTTSTKLLHPFMPFLTEEIWQRAAPRIGDEGAPSIVIARWPNAETAANDPGALADMQTLQEVVTAIRNIRAEMRIPPGAYARALVRCSGEEARVLTDHGAYVRGLARLEAFDARPDVIKPPGAASRVVGLMEVYVPLAGLIDAEAERTRLGREEAKLERTLESAERKLANPQFQERAPTDVVERERRVAETRRQALEKVRRHLAELAANA